MRASHSQHDDTFLRAILLKHSICIGLKNMPQSPSVSAKLRFAVAISEERA